MHENTAAGLTNATAQSGYVGPSWETIHRMTYDEWDDDRFGPRLVVETSDTSAALTATLGHIQSRRQR
jgi:hypothetical protein